MRFAWRGALPSFSNQETVGDVLEAFLGFVYMQKFKPGWWGTEQRELNRLLEPVISKAYLHYDFFETTNWIDLVSRLLRVLLSYS